MCFPFQAEIYKSKKIKGAVRIVKGRSILPDDSTLVEHKISDGNTVNIVIEPDKEITIDVTSGPRTFKHTINNTMTVKELKEMLIARNEVATLYRKFHLARHCSNSKETVPIVDESMHLHYYGIDHGSNVDVVMAFIVLEIEDQTGKRKAKQFSRNTTVHQLKETIMTRICDNEVDDISMFVATGYNSYEILDEYSKKTFGEMFSKNEVVYFIENRFYSESCSIVNNGSEVGRVCCNMDQETVRSVKLRIQDQLGIPTSSVSVTNDEGFMVYDFVMMSDEYTFAIS